MWSLRCLAVVLLFGVTARAPGEVVFTVTADQLTSPATAVFVAGSFNNWSATANELVRDGTRFAATLALPDGRHYYKFVCVDKGGEKHWANDPGNPFLSDDGNHGANNFVDVRGGAVVAVPDGLEKFEWTAPTAKWVSLAGDFNDWRVRQFDLVRQSGGKWAAWLPLRRPLAYKFIINGLWKNEPDPKAPRVPNGFGEWNSYRPARSVTPPAQVTIERTVVAGDTRQLDLVTSYAASADYGHAVALVRKIAEVNAAASGSTSPLVLRSLALEAQIHWRWNRLDDAAACWVRLAESQADTPETLRAINELAAYYLYVRPDNDLGRRLNEIATLRTPNNVELVRAVIHWLNLNLREGRVQETIDTADKLLPRLPAPKPDEKEYAGELSEFWLVKGAAHNRLKQYDKARDAFRKVIEVSPSPDSQSAQRARDWLVKRGYAPTGTP